jgi:hypothetical protein
MITIRDKCIFCNNNTLSKVFENDIQIPQGLTMNDNYDDESLWMPYNIQKCLICKTFQNKYLANLDILYKNSHIAPIGNIRSLMDLKFSEIIFTNSNIKGILEIGAGKGYLADILLEHPNICNKYIIIDPSYTGSHSNRTVVNEYIETVEITKLPVNTLIMSHVFEHFYDPKAILDSILINDTIKYVYICHPNFDAYTETIPLTYNILQCEHTFYIENDFVIKLFNNYGFKLLTKYNHKDYAIMFAFERMPSTNLECINIKTEQNFRQYLQSIENRVQYLNNIIQTSEVPVYIWPCSIHSIMLFKYGLEYNKLDGILDNSPLKVGKFMYGYKLECFSMEHIMKNDNKIKIILNGGCFNKDIAIDGYNNIEFII